MSREKLRWGILGTARIARKNWRAIGQTGNSTVAAVASRSREQGQKFIGECQADLPMDTVPTAFGAYADLLASRDVDAVYVPLPTGLRKEWVIRAAEAGKHVVCEKPCAVNVADLEEMLAACRRNRVQFMDGVMFTHHPRLSRFRERIDGGDLGAVRRITSEFSFLGSPEFFARDIRTTSSLEPHGCLGDLGWYCIRLSLWAMAWKMPRAAFGRILVRHERGSPSAWVPTDFSGELVYDGGVSAGFHCSFLVGHQQWAVISGTQGNLHIPDFVLPPDSDPASSACASQQTLLFRNFAEQIQSSGLNEFWPEVALKTQRVMNACFDAAASNSCGPSAENGARGGD